MKAKAFILSFLASIRKDLKRLFSSKVSAALLVIGPLLMIVLVGFAFQGGQLSGVTVGLYSETTEYVDSVKEMVQSNGFEVIEYEDEETCIQENRDGKTEICLTLSSQDEQIIADVNLDFSRTQLSSAVLSEIRGIFDDLKSDQLSQFGGQLETGATQTQQQLQELEDGLNELKTGLSQTTQDVESQTQNVSLGIENTTLADIPDIQERISQVSSDLTQTEQYLETVRITLLQNEQNLRTQREEAERIFNQLSCSGPFENVDESNTERLLEVIQSATQPECTLLYNYMNYFDNRIEEIDEVSSGVEEQQRNVEGYQDSVTNLSNTKAESLFGEQIQDIRRQQREAGQNVSSGLQDVIRNLEDTEKNISSFRNSSLLTSLDGADESIDPVRLRINRYRELRTASTLDLLFPGILTTLACFVGILVGSVLTMKERKSNAGFRNIISPVDTTYLQFSATATGSLLCASQVFIVLIVGILLFGIGASFTPFLPVFLIFVGGVFTLIGQFIGSFSPNEEVSTLLSITLSVVFLLFSSLIIPIAQMHPILGSIFSFSPFNLTMNALRQILIFAQSMISLLPTLSILGTYFVVAVISLLIYKKLQVQN